MLRITLSKEGTPPRTSTFDKREITVGRTPSNDLVIPEPGVSSSHARILYMDGELTLIDLESTNGTFVNGQRIQGPWVLSPTDEVFICAHRLGFELGASVSPSAATPERPGEPLPASVPAAGPAMQRGGVEPAPFSERPAPSTPAPPSVPPLLSAPPPLADAPALAVPSPAGVGGPRPDKLPGETPTLPPMVDGPLPGPPVDAMPEVAAAPGPAAPEPLARTGGTLPPTGTGPARSEPAPVSQPPPFEPEAASIPSRVPPEPRTSDPPPPDSSSAPATPGSLPARSVDAWTPPPHLAASPAPPSESPASGSGQPDRGLARSSSARAFATVYEMLSVGTELPPDDAQTRTRACGEAERLLGELAERAPEIEVRPWAERIASEVCGLGALSALLAEPDVRDIFVQGPDRVTLRRKDAASTVTDARFSCPQAVEIVVRRLTGTRFGVDNPVVDARTLDGAEVYAVHESVATTGPVVSITLPTSTAPRHSLELLVSQGVMSPVIANLLSTCVHAGLNIAVCAGPGASAFGLLGGLAEAAPASQRQVLVRPAHEPGLLPPGVVVLEGGSLMRTDGAAVMQTLVRTALGLAPERLLVHEVSGPEASEIVAAMGRGLSGTVLGTRAATAEQGVMRLATLVSLAGSHGDSAACARHIAESLELVLVLARFPDGTIRVTEVAEPTVSSGIPRTVEIIGLDPRSGQWTHSGVVPSFFSELQRRGYTVDAGMLSA